MPVGMSEVSLLHALASLRGAYFKGASLHLYEGNKYINAEWILKFYARHFTHLSTRFVFSETSKNISQILQQ